MKILDVSPEISRVPDRQMPIPSVPEEIPGKPFLDFELFWSLTGPPGRLNDLSCYDDVDSNPP